MRQSVTSARPLALLLALASLTSCDLIARFAAGDALDLGAVQFDADLASPAPERDISGDGIFGPDDGVRDCKPWTQPMSMHPDLAGVHAHAMAFEPKRRILYVVGDRASASTSEPEIVIAQLDSCGVRLFAPRVDPVIGANAAHPRDLVVSPNGDVLCYGGSVTETAAKRTSGWVRCYDITSSGQLSSASPRDGRNPNGSRTYIAPANGALLAITARPAATIVRLLMNYDSGNLTSLIDPSSSVVGAKIGALTRVDNTIHLAYRHGDPTNGDLAHEQLPADCQLGACAPTHTLRRKTALLTSLVAFGTNPSFSIWVGASPSGGLSAFGANAKVQQPLLLGGGEIFRVVRVGNVAIALGRNNASRPIIGALSGDLTAYAQVARPNTPDGSVVDAVTLPMTRLALLGNIGGEGWLEICDATCAP